MAYTNCVLSQNLELNWKKTLDTLSKVTRAVGVFEARVETNEAVVEDANAHGGNDSFRQVFSAICGSHNSHVFHSTTFAGNNVPIIEDEVVALNVCDSLVVSHWAVSNVVVFAL